MPAGNVTSYIHTFAGISLYVALSSISEWLFDLDVSDIHVHQCNTIKLPVHVCVATQTIISTIFVSCKVKQTTVMFNYRLLTKCWHVYVLTSLMPCALFTHVTQSVVVVRLFQFFVFLFLIFAVLIVFGVWAILSKNSVSYVVLSSGWSHLELGIL